VIALFARNGSLGIGIAAGAAPPGAPPRRS